MAWRSASVAVTCPVVLDQLVRVIHLASTIKHGLQIAPNRLDIGTYAIGFRPMRVAADSPREQRYLAHANQTGAPVADNVLDEPDHSAPILRQSNASRARSSCPMPFMTNHW